jgi:thioredoxin 1
VSMDVTNDTFDAEVLQSEQPVIVDFWAVWCRPCRAVDRELGKLVEEYPDVRVVKVNTDEEPELTARFNVLTMPTLILFREGEARAACVGAMPKTLIARSLGLADAPAAP